MANRVFLEAGLIQSKVGVGWREIGWEGGRDCSQGRRKGLGGACYQSILPRNEEHANEMQISLYCPQLGSFC